jgi:DNA-binding transcriptional regulator GbsR (MarR family)
MRRAGNIGTIPGLATTFSGNFFPEAAQYFLACALQLFLYFLSRQKRRNTMKDLPPITQKFVLHWGEMGTRWGINRTVAQVHALLFLSEKPLPADEIAKTLGVARSNISTSLRELQNWGIVRIVHVIGDRRDHFESMKDVFAMFRVIARERKRREIEPTLRVLRDCVAEAGKPKAAAPYTRERLADLVNFFEIATTAYEQMEKLPTPAVLKLARLGDKAFKLLGIGAAV